MKKFIAYLLPLLLLTTVGCSVAMSEIQQEEPTSSHEELMAEIERLEQLISEQEDEVVDDFELWLQSFFGDEGRERHPIDIDLEKAIRELPDSNPRGLSSLLRAYGDIWKAEMENTIASLQEILSEDNKRRLNASQEHWEAYMENNNALEYWILHQATGGGTMMSHIAVSSHYNMYRERTLFLAHIYRNAAYINQIFND